jgi:hypothetical protein
MAYSSGRMGKISSDKLNIKCSSEKIFTFLSDFNNFGKLMPEQVTNWKATQDACSFSIQGLADLAMKITERIPHSKLVYSSESPSPFEYSLSINLCNISQNECSSELVFDANINNVMMMMVTRPLQNFVNILNQKLRETFER